MSWPLRPLSTLATFTNGFPFKPEDVTDSGRPIVRIRQLLDQQAPLDLFDGTVPSNVEINTGDLIFSWSATLDCRYWNRGPALLNQHLFRVDPQPGVEKAWLRWAVLWAVGQLRPYMHGSAMAHVTRPMLKLVKVPFPPPVEQRVIAKALDLECARIDDASAGCARAIATLAATERDIADRLCFGRDTVPLKAVADIRSGVTLNSSQRFENAVSVPYLRVANVKAGWLDLDEVKAIEVSSTDLDAYRLAPGDLLLTEGGDVDKLGRGALWQGSLPLAVFQNHIFAVRARPGLAEPRFLSWATRS